MEARADETQWYTGEMLVTDTEFNLRRPDWQQQEEEGRRTTVAKIPRGTTCIVIAVATSPWAGTYSEYDLLVMTPIGVGWALDGLFTRQGVNPLPQGLE